MFVYNNDKEEEEEEKEEKKEEEGGAACRKRYILHVAGVWYVSGMVSARTGFWKISSAKMILMFFVVLLEYLHFNRWQRYSF